MSTKYPAQIDTTITLPLAIDNLTPVQGKVFNDLRAAVIAIEAELGTKPSGLFGTVRARLDSLTGGGGGGGVQLGQDLGGSLDLPLVIGIQGRVVSSAAPSDGWILTWNASLNQWEPAPNGGGTPNQITSFVVSPSVREVSESTVTPAFTASYNFTTSSVILTDNAGSSPKDVSSTPTSFNSNGTFVRNAFGQSYTFTITALPGSLTRSASISWGQKNYYGVSTPGQTGGAFIVSLTATAIAFTRNTSFTVTANPGEKIYYATRTAYGTPTFKDHDTGFAVDIGSSGNFSVTNGFGFIENYQLWETTFSGLGTITVDVT
jgi:hypothetical protein